MTQEKKFKVHPNSGLKEKRLKRKKFQLIVGERLAEIRNSMIPRLSQASLAYAVNLNQSVIQRIETGGGTIDTLLVVLQYFLNHHYNLNHILAVHNENYKLKIGPEETTLDSYFQIPD